MPGSAAVFDREPFSKTTRALLMVSLVFGLSLTADTAAAPGDVRGDISAATQQPVRDSPRRAAEGTSVSIPGAFVRLGESNASGDVIGLAVFLDTGISMPFLAQRNGTITPISCPTTPTLSQITLTGLNNSRTVVGFWGFRPEEGGRTGFRWRNGQCEELPIQDTVVVPTDISENGIIVGVASPLTQEADPFYGFMLKDEQVIIVEHPDATLAAGGFTRLSAVAPNGLAVGWASPNQESFFQGDQRWFVYRDGVFESFAVPVAPRDFRPFAISPSGVVSYVDTDGVVRSFRVTSTLTRF